MYLLLFAWHIFDDDDEIFPSTVLIISNDKKVRYKMDCYILQTFLLVGVLPFTICYHYAEHRWKQTLLAHQQFKMEK